MESCPTSGCAMGIAKEPTDQVEAGASLSVCMETGSEDTCWGGQIDSALEVVTSAGVCLRETDTAVAPNMESCLQEEWPGQQSLYCKKRGWEEAEGEAPPKQLKQEIEETEHREALAEFQASTAMAIAYSESMPAPLPLTQKPTRGRKPKQRAEVCKGGTPQEPRVQGEVPGPSENGPSLPGKVPKKRGRKSKAELLLLKLSQGLECQSPDPLHQQESLVSDESPDCLDATPGGRPKRRAAKVALLYLQELAEELTSACQPPTQGIAESLLRPEEPSRKRRGRKPNEQKLENDEDADFVPSEEGLVQAEEEEEEENDLLLSEASEPEVEHSPRGVVRSKAQCRGFASNGLHNSVMAPVWQSLRVTYHVREQLHSHWEFPEWVPSARKWVFLSESEVNDFLPGETKSPLFSIKREGLQEDSSVLYRINRFNALQPHEERLDMTFFVGGPIWAMEWCPTPEGSIASQYVAISCNQGMDDRHSLVGIHAGPALLQLWELGPIQQDTGSTTKPALAYAIATSHGCIWDMKFCPSGAWELPASRHKSFQMSRLGLLAVAFSNGKVLVYSLPHGQDLHAYRRAQPNKGSSKINPSLSSDVLRSEEAGLFKAVLCHAGKKTFHSSLLDRELSVNSTNGPSPRHAICKVQCVATLQVGSIQAGNPSECGQCFTLAWMPTKPHNHLAAGFYDGTVALWNLSSKSLLQRVRLPDGSLKLYPFHCFLAHDHAVRNIQWCKANSNFMVTAGNDRKIKFWDLRRLHEPVNSIKRFLSTEIAWLLPYSGITVAQDNCYASYGLCGIHYLDAGYLGFRAYFVAPRKGTVWSISGSDWLNSIAAGDSTGELVAAMMPDLSINPHNVKRPSERRFTIYKADLLPCGPVSADARADTCEKSPAEGRTYSESVARNYIRFQDTDMRSFKGFFRRKTRKQIPVKEAKEGDNLGRLQLEAVHKVRFSPNLDCHSWLVSGGQSGIVRVHCLRALASPPSRKLFLECQAQFSSMFHAEGQADGPGGNPAGVYTAVS